MLDIFGVTPTRMTFSIAFAYLEGEHLNNVVWALQRFRGLFVKVYTLPRLLLPINFDECNENSIPEYYEIVVSVLH